ncbi:DUF998 domain-containing protein [Pseudonocardia endophytica]|uniref:Uncharacterized protein DUF998 n=1 Tax=Pseudonocardia endophytica TaxID=401976 RepID=A0A4R1HVI6_PSEEN|nr:DUF998 domain-containing protein [Pseudonocardia endophytica]TCK25015.1 uncharacterized protein DUF998 [Pseudonocardia endophytica]
MVGRGVAWVGVAVVAVAVVVLHVVGTGTVDPVTQTISDYVVLQDGAALLGLAAAGLIAAGLAGAVSLSATARRLLLLWAAAVLLVAVFPTNLPGQPADVSALVHRWAGALVFALPPLAGVVGARSAGSRRVPLLAASVAAAVAAGAFLLAHAPHVLAGADVFPWLGLVERVAYVALLALLIVFAAPAPAAPPPLLATPASPVGPATGRTA